MLKNNGFHNRHSPILRAFSPLSLFASGAPGAWYDPSDYGATGTLFQDSAGTVPVTAVEQPVGLMLDKSQGLLASTKGGQLIGVSGSGFDTPSATANQITGDIDIRVQASLVSWTPAAINAFCSRVTTGGNTADSYEFWISTSGVLQLLTVSGTTNTNVASSVAVGFAAGTTNWVRVTWQQSSGFVNFYTSSDGVTWTQNGTVNRAGTTGATNAGSRLLRVGARVEGSFPLNGTIYKTQIYNGINGTLAVDFNPTLYTSGATYTAATGEVWTITGSNARIVPNGNHAFQATSASRPVLKIDGNGKLYLKFDGVDDSLSTNSISFTSTDKMSVFAGVRKLSDAGIAVGFEFSSNPSANNGVFSLYIPAGASPSYRYDSKGSSSVAAIASTGFASPISNVVTALSDILGDLATLRVNGTQVAQTTSDQGTGNYGNYPLYIGRRNNASLPFNGQMYSMIIVGKAVTAGELTSTETYVNQKTGAY